MGNEASCTAQGFFIQMGTTSAFLNVSLAIYYFSMIRLGHTETRIKRNRIWLFSCPIVVGLAYAFAGIPFYDMVRTIDIHVTFVLPLHLSDFYFTLHAAVSLVQQQC